MYAYAWLSIVLCANLINQARVKTRSNAFVTLLYQLGAVIGQAASYISRGSHLNELILLCMSFDYPLVWKVPDDLICMNYLFLAARFLGNDYLIAVIDLRSW